MTFVRLREVERMRRRPRGARPVVVVVATVFVGPALAAEPAVVAELDSDSLEAVVVFALAAVAPLADEALLVEARLGAPDEEARFLHLKESKQASERWWKSDVRIRTRPHSKHADRRAHARSRLDGLPNSPSLSFSLPFSVVLSVLLGLSVVAGWSILMKKS